MEFLFGLLAGLLLGGWLAWERFLRYERPPIIVTPETLAQLNEAVIMAWLDAKGLMWQPKGIDFKATVKGSDDGRH